MTAGLVSNAGVGAGDGRIGGQGDVAVRGAANRGRRVAEGKRLPGIRPLCAEETAAGAPRTAGHDSGVARWRGSHLRDDFGGRRERRARRDSGASGKFLADITRPLGAWLCRGRRRRDRAILPCRLLVKKQCPFADLNGVAVRQPLFAGDGLTVDQRRRPIRAARPAFTDKAQAMTVLRGQRFNDQMGRRNGRVAEEG